MTRRRKIKMKDVPRKKRIRKRMLGAALALITLFTSVPIFYSEAAAPLVANGSFQETDAYGVPEGWTYRLVGTQTGSLTRTEAGGKDGAYVKMDPAEGVAMLETSGEDVIRIAGGQNYQLSWYGYSQGNLHVEIEQYSVDEDGNAGLIDSSMETTAYTISRTDEWKKQSLVFAAEEDASYAVIRFVAEGGESGVDEVTLSMVSDRKRETVGRMALLDASQGETVFPNGDFAAYTEDDAGALTSLAHWDITGMTNLKSLTIEENTEHGNALKAVKTNRVAGHFRLRHEAITVEEGATYIFSIWVKNNGIGAGDTRSYLVLRDAAFKKSISLTSNPDTRRDALKGSWEKIEFSYVIPEGYGQMVVDFQFEQRSGSRVADSEYWIADMSIVKEIKEEEIKDDRMFPNGDFIYYKNNSEGKLTTLNYWTIPTHASVESVAVEENVSYGGGVGNVLTLVNTNNVSGSNPVLRHDALDLEAGKSYEFTGWFKTDTNSASDGEVYMVLRRGDLTGNAIILTSSQGSEVNTTIRSTKQFQDGWKCLTFDIMVPEGYDKLIIDFQIVTRFDSGNYKVPDHVTFQFAGMSMKEVAKNTAIISNGDFSDHILYQDGQVAALKGWVTDYLTPADSVTIEKDETFGNVLKVVNGRDQTAQFYHNATNMEAGKTYIIKYWIKTDATKDADANIYMVLRDGKTLNPKILTSAAGSEVNSAVYATSGKWKQVGFYLTIPAGYEPQILQLQMAPRPDSTKERATYWIAGVTARESSIGNPGLNLDFEADPDISNWSGEGSGSVKVVAGGGRDGSNGLQISHYSDTSNTLAKSQKIEVEASATYEVTYWAKLEQTGAAEPNGWLQPVQYNAENKAANGASFDPTATGNHLQKRSGDITWRWEWRMVGNTDWTYVKRAFTVADDAAYIYLRFITNGNGSVFTIDNVTIRRIDPVQNYDFEEVDDDGMPSYFYLTDARAAVATVVSDDRYYHSGQRSAHITKDTLSSYNAYETCYRFPVTSGYTYEFSFWMASANADPHANLRMNMVYYDEAGNRVYMPDGKHSITYGTKTYLNSGPTISEWTQVMTRSTVPEGAYTAVIQFYMQEGAYDLWLDDIYLEIVEMDDTVITEHNDLHAVDQDGNISGWELDNRSGTAVFTTAVENGNRYGVLNNTSGENYMKFGTHAIETQYTYYLTGKYRSTTDATARLKFYDWRGALLDTELETVSLAEVGSWTEFEITFTAPSCVTTGLLVGTSNPGTVEVDNITIYMIGKPVTVGDWDGSWVWYPENATTDALYQYRYFRYKINLAADPVFCPLQFTADDRYDLYVNGELVTSNMSMSGDTWSSVQKVYLEDYLKKGDNTIAFRCYNYAAEAGLLFDGKWTLSDGTEAICASDVTVKTTKTVETEKTWMDENYNDSAWVGSTVIGKPPIAPWGAVFYDSSIYSATCIEIIEMTGDGDMAVDGEFTFSLKMKLDNKLTSNFPLNVVIWQKNSINDVSKSSLKLLTHTNMAEWPVNEEFTVKFSMSVPYYLESGNYTVQLEDKYISISNPEITDGKFINFGLEQEVSYESSVSKIEMVHGAPVINVNGELTPFYAYSRPDSNSRNRDYEPEMINSGIDLYVVRQGCLGKPDYDYCWSADGVVDYDAFDAPIYDTLANNNDAYLIVQVGMYAPDWWIEENPDQQVQVSYRNGKVSTYIEGGSVSYGSEKFVKEAGEVLRLLMEHMKTQSYYSRVVGINLCSGKSFENMYWGSKSTEYAPDFSEPGIEAFRKYLTKLYGTDAALQEAWNDTSVTLATALPPTLAECSELDTTGGFLNVETQKRILDHHLFLNDVVSETLLYWGDIIDEVHGGNIVLGCFNGYLFSAGSYMDIGAQHTSFQKLLESDMFSFFVSPANYSERLLGTADTYMGFQDAVQAYGKMVVIEEDHRTCLVMHYSGTSWDVETDFGVGGTHTMHETLLQMKKNVANAMVSGNGIWFFDMHGGWFNDDMFYSLSRVCADEYLVSQYKDKVLNDSDIAYFVDDEYLSYFLSISDAERYPSNYISYAGFRLQRKQLNRIGQSYDVYSMGSLADGKVEGHKVNIIFCAYQMTEEERAAVKKYLQKDGQIVLFLYTAGLSDGKTDDISLMEEITGIPLCYSTEWGNISVTVTKESPITKGYVGRSYGPQGPATSILAQNPIIWADTSRDASLEVLGTLYTDGSKAALVAKDMGDWTSMYSSSPNVPYEILRNLIEVQGGKFYSDDPNDIIWDNGAYVALHSTTGGTKTIHLDGNYAVYDVWEGRFVSMDTDIIQYEQEPGDTHIFRLQTPECYEVLSVTQGGHGTISSVGITKLKEGSDYELAITPDEGYDIREILVNGVAVEKTTLLKLTAIKENIIIRVFFKKISTGKSEEKPDNTTPSDTAQNPGGTTAGAGDGSKDQAEEKTEEGSMMQKVKKIKTEVIDVLDYIDVPLWLMLTGAVVLAGGIVLLVILLKRRKKGEKI